MRVDVLNGVNLDVLDRRDPTLYGGLSLPELEARIDGLVAHLYGLNEDEYRLILDDLALPDPVRVGALNAYRDTKRRLVAQ